MRDSFTEAQLEQILGRVRGLERMAERQAATIERLCAVLTGHEATLVKLELTTKRLENTPPAISLMTFGTMADVVMPDADVPPRIEPTK